MDGFSYDGMHLTARAQDCGWARSGNSLECGGAADSCDRIAGGLSHLRTRVVESAPQIGQRGSRGRPDRAQGVAGRAARLGVGAVQQGSKRRHRRRRARADVADVLCHPGPHTRVGILQCRQKRRQHRTEVEFRAAVGEVPPAAPNDIQRHSDIAPHLRIRIAEGTGQSGHARRSEGVELVIDLLTSRFQIRQGRRCRRGGDSLRRSPYRQGQLAQLRDHGVSAGSRVSRLRLRGERRPSGRDENDGRDGTQETGVQHADILTPGRNAAGDQADSRVRGSNNTMSPGALEATMRLRPVAFAR